MTAAAYVIPADTRRLVQRDLPFIYRSWLQSLRTDYEGRDRRMRDTDFFVGHHDVIERLLERTSCVVVCSMADADQIFGYACGNDDVLHYVYVKPEFRRYGFARWATGSMGRMTGELVVSHWTKAVRRWKEREPVRYNPYLAR